MYVQVYTVMLYIGCVHVVVAAYCSVVLTDVN